MNKYKKLAINIAVLTFLLTGGITATYAASPELKNKQKNSNYNKKIALLESFEGNDYENWKKYIGKNSNLAKYISEDKFKKFIEIRSLARNGKHDMALKKSEEFSAELEQTLENIIVNKKNKKKTMKVEKAIKKIKKLKTELKNSLV